MNKTIVAFAAIAIGLLISTRADAMNIGSLSRQNPALGLAQAARVADPAVCLDLTCGIRGRTASDYSPVLHMIFASVGDFARSHLHFAFANRQIPGIQPIAVASAD